MGIQDIGLPRDFGYVLVGARCESKWFPNRALATIVAKPGGNAQMFANLGVRQVYYDNINI